MWYRDGHGEEGWHKVFSAPLMFIFCCCLERQEVCAIYFVLLKWKQLVSLNVYIFFLLNNVSFILERALAPTLSTQ